MGAGGVLCSLRAARGCRSGWDPGNLGTSCHFPLPGTWHRTTCSLKEGVECISASPSLALMKKCRLNKTHVYNCTRAGGSPAPQRISDVPPSPMWLLMRELQVFSSGKTWRTPGRPRPVCNHSAINWSLPAVIWIQEPPFSLLALLENCFI